MRRAARAEERQAMKQILKCKKTLLCLLLAAALAAGAVPPRPLPHRTAWRLQPGYDYTRFKDAGITLNVYNWGEYISDGADGSMDVVKEFEDLTGIRVNYTTYDTNESLYAKLKSGGGDYDVIIPSDYMIGKMAAEGMLEELDPANIPNAALIGERIHAPNRSTLSNKYSVAYTWGLVCIVYNTDDGGRGRPGTGLGHPVGRKVRRAGADVQQQPRRVRHCGQAAGQFASTPAPCRRSSRRPKS